MFNAIIEVAEKTGGDATAVRPFRVDVPEGHFAAWERPELFAQELRAAFKSLC